MPKKSSRLKKRVKKKSRIKIPYEGWRGILIGACLMNVLAFLYRSHLTDLRQVRIEGATVAEQPLFNVMTMFLKGQPVMQINPDKLTEKIESISDVESCEVSRNVFGRIFVRIHYRKPIAVLEGTPLALDESGNLFSPSFTLDSDLRSIRIPNIIQDYHGALLEPLDMESMVTAIKEWQMCSPSLDGILTQSLDGTLNLNRGKNGTVNFGGTDKLSKKFAKLRELQSSKPNVFLLPTIINLVSPEHPTAEPFFEPVNEKKPVNITEVQTKPQLNDSPTQ